MKKLLLVSAIASGLFAGTVLAGNTGAKANGGKASAVSQQYKQLAQKIMDKEYGNYDQTNACWMIPYQPKALDEDIQTSACMKIVSIHPAIDQSTGKQIAYLYAGGDLYDQNGDNISGPTYLRGVGGNIGLFVFEPDGDNYKLLAKLSYQESGALAAAPSEARFGKLGKNLYGWQLNSYFYVVGGWAQTDDDFYAYESGKGIKSLGSVQTFYESMNGKDKTATEAKLSIDSSNAAAAVYPIKAKVNGTNAKGRRIKPQTFTINYNAADGEYAAPHAYDKLMGASD